MTRSLAHVANELLVLRCQAGDERALAVLYERWSPRLARHAARLTGRRDALADVCQEAWLSIARGLPRLDDPAAFPAWAYRIVGRRCADWIRQRQRDGANTTLETAQIPAPPEAGTADDDIAAVRRALRVLPADQRALLALFYGEELGVSSIARAMDIPVGTVKSRLHHARRALALLLDANDDERKTA
jgi:RNA polymerase sigma-70 factor (ECF subfamily)